MAAVWGCAFGAFLKMKNPDEKGLAIGYVISAIAGGRRRARTLRYPGSLAFRRTMLGMFIGGAIGAVFSGLMGVTYYLAGGASNFLVFTNYLQGGQMNTVWAIVGMAISFVIAAAVVFATGFSKEELAEWRPKAKPFGRIRPYLHDRAPSGASPAGPFLQGRLIGGARRLLPGLAKRQGLSRGVTAKESAGSQLLYQTKGHADEFGKADR